MIYKRINIMLITMTILFFCSLIINNIIFDKSQRKRIITKKNYYYDSFHVEKEIISLLEINNSQWEKVLDDPGMSDETRNLATDAINQNNKDIAEWQNQKEQLQKAKEKVETLE